MTSDSKVQELAGRIGDYYRRPGNECGGCCHVVLDDENLDEGTIQFALGYCEENADADGAQLMRDFLDTDQATRREALRRASELA
jgi:hypothetical protein